VLFDISHFKHFCTLTTQYVHRPDAYVWYSSSRVTAAASGLSHLHDVINSEVQALISKDDRKDRECKVRSQCGASIVQHTYQ
jgi:hypothetical protein